MTTALEARYRRVLNLLPQRDRDSLGAIVLADLMESRAQGQDWPRITETMSLLRLICARWANALELPTRAQRRQVSQLIAAFIPAMLTIPVTMAIAFLGGLIGQAALRGYSRWTIAVIVDGRMWVDTLYWLVAVVALALWLLRRTTAARIMTGMLLVVAVIVAYRAWISYADGTTPDPRMTLSPFAFWILPATLSFGFLTWRPDTYAQGCELLQTRNRCIAIALCIIPSIGALVFMDPQRQPERIAIAAATVGLALLSTRVLSRRLVITFAATLICIGMAIRPLTHGFNEILIDHQIDAALLGGVPLVLAPLVYVIVGSVLRSSRAAPRI
jgi:hypothetical protein